MGRSKGRSRGQPERDKNFFTIQVKLVPTDEVFTLTQVHQDMKISELKKYLEFASGLPTNLQRISYLDEGDLLEESDIRSNHIVPGATLRLRVWPMWTTLVEAVAQNDIDMVMQLGVTSTSDYRTPNSDYMSKRAKKAWLDERAFVALCMAANRGLDKLCTRLIENGANVNDNTPHGRTALHIASSKGHGHIVDLLLEKGADIDAEDDNGETALSIADRFGFKSCGRHLFLFHWQQRAKKITPARHIPLMAHQLNDSLYPVWKRGARSQVYLTQQLGPGEFVGTSLGAPRQSLHPSVRRKLERDRLFFAKNDDVSHHESEEDDYFPDETKLPSLEDEKKKRVRIKSGDDVKSKNLKRPETYDEWLQKLKDAEGKIKEEKLKLKEGQKQKKMEEEEKKKEENERLGYEKWLAQRQEEKELASHQSTVRSHSRHDHTVQEIEDETEEGDVRQRGHVGAFRLYLRSLGKSKAGVSYEDWLDEKEREIIGKGPSTTIPARP